MSPPPPTAHPFAAVALGLVTLVGWNTVFLHTVEHGVVVPIALFASMVAAAALWVCRDAWPRWFSGAGRGAAVGLVAGLALAALSWAAWWVGLRLPLPLQEPVEGLYALLRMPPGPVVGLPLVLLTITAEEVLFRGLLLDALRQRMGPAPAVFAAAGLYTCANLGSGTWVLPVVAMVLGVLWGAMAVRSRGLWAPLVCHAVWDIAIFVVVPLVP